jgi:two-component system cell cycle response regulator DivK
MAKILYIEDNPQNMRLVRKILKHAGYDVIEAEDGTSGLKVAKDEMPDLILMDVNLPDIDGLEVTAELKKDSVSQNIPIIALTANAMVGDREKALEAGCDGYLPKPINRQELLNIVQEFIGDAI